MLSDDQNLFMRDKNELLCKHLHVSNAGKGNRDPFLNGPSSAAWSPPIVPQQGAPGQTRYCGSCGRDIGPYGTRCGYCGAGSLPAVPGQKSKLTAGLLGIFLGGLGIHSFYLGFTRRGVLQIVVTFLTLGVGSLWGFIEGILILVDKMPYDANGQPLGQ